MIKREATKIKYIKKEGQCSPIFYSSCSNRYVDIVEKAMSNSTTMAELLKKAGMAVNEVDEEDDDVKHSSSSRRGKDGLTRPEVEFVLKAVSAEIKEVVKTQKDPTDDLVFLPRVFAAGKMPKLPELGAGYVVEDKDTHEFWYVHDKKCLDANFIYRDDLKITEVNSEEEAQSTYLSGISGVNTGMMPNKVKFILDDPGAETYEVYSDSAYPSQKYGKATPTGMFVHRYQNRFHRDMAIIELDLMYSEASKKQALKLSKKSFGASDALIVSDGAWLRNTSTYAFFYLDREETRKVTGSRSPSEEEQAVLISELNGAYYALLECYRNHKTNISYYYDNTSIVNVFRNRKTEYINEVKRYKQLCEKMHCEGYRVTFYELHPKSDENKDKLNKALTFLHNTCDKECEAMAKIYTRDYKQYALTNESDGTTFGQVKEQFKPKGKPGQSGNKNNYRK